MQSGDVALFTIDTDPQHVGIVAHYAHGGMSLIHSYAPSRGVVETHLDALWRKRMRAVYRFPRLA